jgi:spermidine synthase
VQIFNMDGFDYFKQNQKQYDVIYLDAFLQPTEETDSTGNPLKLKTLAFLKDIQKHLTQTGLFVINLNDHEGLQQDIATIRAAFVESYVWEVPRTGNYIAVGLKNPLIGSFKQNLKYVQTELMPHFSFENLFERVWISKQKKENP